jgi:hypothetical protein
LIWPRKLKGISIQKREGLTTKVIIGLDLMPGMLPQLPDCATIADLLLFVQFALSLGSIARMDIFEGGLRQLARYWAWKELLTRLKRTSIVRSADY